MKRTAPDLLGLTDASLNDAQTDEPVRTLPKVNRRKSAAITFRVEPELREAFRQACDDDGRKMGFVLQEAMRHYVNRDRLASPWD